MDTKSPVAILLEPVADGRIAAESSGVAVVQVDLTTLSTHAVAIEDDSTKLSAKGRSDPFIDRGDRAKWAIVRSAPAIGGRRILRARRTQRQRNGRRPLVWDSSAGD
jgi:hypothetical protein